MSATICCPTCWTWSEYKHSTNCKRCGTPLILPDGRRVDEVAGAPPEAAAGAGYAFNAPMASLTTSPEGIDWVAAARWITAGYGALTIIGILAYGFVYQYLSVPVQDPATGLIVEQTINVRPFLLVVAIIVAIIFGLFTWLVGYTFARVIWLLFIVLTAFGTLSKLGGEPGAVVLGTVLSLGFDASIAFVLVMSLLPAPGRTPART